MTAQPIKAVAPPHASCRLAHHNVGHRVVWTRGLTTLRGTVMGHRGDQRFITIQLPDGTAVAMPCGAVAADR